MGLLDPDDELARLMATLPARGGGNSVGAPALTAPSPSFVPGPAPDVSPFMHALQGIHPDALTVATGLGDGGPVGGLAARVVSRPPGAARGLLSTEGYQPVRPVPQRQLDPASAAYQPGLGEYVPGGRYLSMPDKADITGQTRAGGRIEAVPTPGRAVGRMVAAPGEAPPMTRADGDLVKTNMFRRGAGWTWLQAPEGWADTPALISVETGGKHHYVLRTDFERAMDMARYAKSPNEPRLRPSAYGDVELGPVAGRISVRGKEHPVYESAYVFPRGLLGEDPR